MIRYDHVDHVSYKTIDAIQNVMAQGGSIGLQCLDHIFAIYPWPKKSQIHQVMLISQQSDLLNIHSPDRALFKKLHQHRNDCFSMSLKPLPKWSKKHHWPHHKDIDVIYWPVAFAREITSFGSMVIEKVDERGNHPLIVVDEGFSMINHIEQLMIDD
ncbi:MAG: hypothetical protein ACON5A_04835 [Candidatus Comchoanobacterales bacterium]